MLPLSLYIHIPWCIQKCHYCDFNSHAEQNKLPEDAYLSALLSDLNQDIRPLSKLAAVSEIRHQAGAENRSVHGVNEDSSTAFMPNFATSVEFRKRSIINLRLFLQVLLYLLFLLATASIYSDA